MNTGPRRAAHPTRQAQVHRHRRWRPGTRPRSTPPHGPRTCFEARIRTRRQAAAGRTVRRDTPRSRQARGHRPTAAPARSPTRARSWSHRLLQRRCELCENRRNGGSPPGPQPRQPRQARTRPARVGRPHGEDAAQDAHRLRPLPRLHPRQPRRGRGINHWRAPCAERCTPGSEGGCAARRAAHPTRAQPWEARPAHAGPHADRAADKVAQPHSPGCSSHDRFPPLAVGRSRRRGAAMR